MTDLAAFAEEGFDPKAWINEACAGKPHARLPASSVMRCRLLRSCSIPRIAKWYNVAVQVAAVRSSRPACSTDVCLHMVVIVAAARRTCWIATLVDVGCWQALVWVLCRHCCNQHAASWSASSSSSSECLLSSQHSRCGCTLGQKRWRPAPLPHHPPSTPPQTAGSIHSAKDPNNLIILLVPAAVLQAGRPPTESLERFLSELEMRLQLGAEEVEASLSECSSAGLRRVPFALQEVGRLRGDVGALQVRILLTVRPPPLTVIC
jgi:hypothetical protein